MRWFARSVGLLVLMLAMLPAGAQAQTGSRFFPETGKTVSGRFLEYWQNNGGLAVFGFPLTDQAEENGLQTQYFERQRFELHPENARPYDVLLGRLGAELLNRGGGQPPAGTGTPPGCVYFEATQFNVCNQQGNTGFLNYWQTHGLEFDGRSGTSYAESLALFGFPVSNAYDYVTSSGDTVIAQWFERARFEWHPNNPNPYKVLLGRLGAEVRENVPNPPTVSTVKIFLIALNDNGASGKPIGCGDSVVGVDVPIEPTPAPLRAALAKLFANKNQYYGESGLMNALWESDIRIDSLTIEQGRANVALSGTLRIGGVCATPRIIAQIEETVKQFPSVTSLNITFNGMPLADAV